MAYTSKYEGRWEDGKRGGSIRRVHHTCWISTFACGMNDIRHFANERDAQEWAAVTTDMEVVEITLLVGGIAEQDTFYVYKTWLPMVQYGFSDYLMFGEDYSRTIRENLETASLFAKRGEYTSFKRYYHKAFLAWQVMEDRKKMKEAADV